MSDNDDFLSAVDDGSELLATVEEQARQLAQAEKDRAEMLELLREMEFCVPVSYGNVTSDVMTCPVCDVDKGSPHDTDCKLAALLARFPR